MRICIFSDVHGNYETLAAMLDREAGHVDKYIFVGDIWGYFYGQKEIIDRLMTLPDMIAVRGNHEEYYLGDEDKSKYLDRYGDSYLMEISKEQKKYLEDLPLYKDIDLADKHFGIYHGGLEDYLEQRIYPDTDMDCEVLKDYDYLILGHTHYRMYRKLGNTIVINPGSLGQPRDAKGFSYCVLDTDKETCEFKNVECNVKALVEQVRNKDSDKYVYTYLKKKYKDFI